MSKKQKKLDIANNDDNSIKNELRFLQKEIKEHDDLYYNKNVPKISDAKYDALKRKLNELEEKYPNLVSIKSSPTQTVGSKPDSKFGKVKHNSPMLSLANAFSIEDVVEFINRIKKQLNLIEEDIEFYCEPKIDGLSFSAIYSEGKLVKAATRGDGTYGEDITENIKVINDIPRQVELLDDFEIRGEIYMGKNDFLELNDIRSSKGESLFANPRNAAAGSLRQLNPKITKERKLQSFIFGGSITGINSQNELMERFTQLGFKVNKDIQLSKDITDIQIYYEKLYKIKANLSYDIDGLVYKVNSLDLQDKLGFVSRAPRWALAHKFPAEKAITTIEDIFVQISRYGVLTPVAKLKPINIGGVLVTKASLHNEDEIKRKDFRIGDKVTIQRAGDVIPQVLEAHKKERKGDEKKYIFPDHCPFCNSLVERRDDAARRCTGGNLCKEQVIQKLYHFISKDAFNIDGLGREHIRLFYIKGIIKNFTDIFRLKSLNESLNPRLEKWDGWGEKSVLNLFSSIDRSRNITFDRFLYSLGISFVGSVTASIISEYYLNLTNLLDSINKPDNLEQLIQIYGIGEHTAKEIVNYFNNDENVQEINKLLTYINIIETNVNEIKSELTGKSVIFTGTLNNMTRDRAQEIAKQLGAKVTSSLSKNTDILVAGDSPGSKYNKAVKMGTNILDELKWNELIAKYNVQ